MQAEITEARLITERLSRHVFDPGARPVPFPGPNYKRNKVSGLRNFQCVRPLSIQPIWPEPGVDRLPREIWNGKPQGCRLAAVQFDTVPGIDTVELSHRSAERSVG